MLIIPAIDLIGGRCVRLSQGDYARETVYDADPGAVAARFEGAGAEWIHVVDLDGAKFGEPRNLDSIRSVLASVRAKIEVGGGIRSLETARRLLDMGVSRIVVGTKLVQDPELSRRFFEELGDMVVAGIDARNGEVAVAGWLEGSTTSAKELAKRVEGQGAKRIILTDIARDGVLSGPNLAMLEEVASGSGIPVIASGGVGALRDIESVTALESMGVEGVILGRALYEGLVDLKDAIQIGRRATTMRKTARGGTAQ